MKFKNIITFKKTATFLVVATLLFGCNKDIFQIVDENGIDSDIWNDEGAVNALLYRGYDLMMPNWPAAGDIHNTSDESGSANTTLLYGTLTDNGVTYIASSNSMTASRYWDIRRCNVGIQGIDQGTLPDNKKQELKAQFRFLRAWIYFNLVRLYGGVPLVLDVQKVDADVLDVPRAKTSACIAQIASDLDSAIKYLPAAWPTAETGKITRATAAAMKGKVLLYWASPQFNPTNIASRWEDAYQANKAAYDLAVTDGYALLANYANIFVDESSSNKEVMMIRKLDAISVSPTRGTNLEYVARPASETSSLTGGGGSYQPTWNLVQAYTMKDGQAITEATSGYNTVQFWQNRDPRMDASISYNGGVWPLSGKTGRKQWSYDKVADEGSRLTATGFYCKRICNPTLSPLQTFYDTNVGGGSGMDYVEFRFAELIMNLAECANETGRSVEAADMVRKIRVRAGIIAGSYDYGLSLASDQTKMRDLIMNERMVEFAMEGKRYHDLRRTRRYHLLSGQRRIGMKWAPKGGTTNVATAYSSLWMEALTATGQKRRDTADLNNVAVYQAFFTPSTFNVDASTAINFPQTYYFYPLPTGFLGSSYLHEQTIGWSGGTFDPLQ